MKNLVSTDWLSQNILNEDLILLDASLPMTASGKVSAFQSEMIPNARPFDLKNDFSDTSSQFSNTYPSIEQFQQAAQKLGINTSSKIVVYDNLGVYSSPRAWWLFRLMGHENIALLNGGLPEWINQGHQTVPFCKEEYPKGNFRAKLRPHLVKQYQQVLDNIETPSFCIIDARSQNRFNGIGLEPRKHLKSGHIPNSINIPYPRVLHNGQFKSKKELRLIFESKELPLPYKEITFSCGSGLTACIVMFARQLIYPQQTSLYDGSWTEWATKQDLTIR